MQIMECFHGVLHNSSASLLSYMSNGMKGLKFGYSGLWQYVVLYVGTRN